MSKRAAILYIIIETCRIHGVELYAYLKGTLEGLPSATNQTVHLLTPRGRADARAAKAAENR